MHLTLKTNRAHVSEIHKAVGVWETVLKGPLVLPVPRPSSGAADCPGLKVKQAHLLILKCWSEEQASNLTHTSRSVLEHSPGTENDGRHLHSLPSLCSRALVSTGEEL